MPHDLYEVDFWARPLPAHHRFWELGEASVQMFLMAQSGEEAAQRAEALLPSLLWEVDESRPRPLVRLLQWPQPLADLAPSESWALLAARDGGFAFRVLAGAPGVELREAGEA